MIAVKVFGSGSSGNSYLIDDGLSQLMIECGVRFAVVQEKMAYDFSRLTGILISHEHRDHCKYIKSIIDGTSADIYATNGTIEAMHQDNVLKLKESTRYRFKSIKYRKTIKIGSWRVTPFETKHDVAEPCGFLIDNVSGDRLVFITDSYYVKYKFNNVTHMMIEMNYSKEEMNANLKHGFDLKRKERLLESHFDYENSLEFIRSNKSKMLQEIWLIHLSETNGNPKLFKEETQKLTGVPVYIA